MHPIAYEELGAEAIYELEVEDMPLIVTTIFMVMIYLRRNYKHQKKKI